MNLILSFVRLATLLLIPVFFLTACKKSITPVASVPQPQLAGTWNCEKDSSNGATFQSKVTVASNGAYFCDATNYSPKSFKTYHVEGTWEIKDDLLIDTIKKHSQTKATLPSISTAKIIRFTTNELALRYQYDSSNFFDAVFIKQ